MPSSISREFRIPRARARTRFARSARTPGRPSTCSRRAGRSAPGSSTRRRFAPRSSLRPTSTRSRSASASWPAGIHPARATVVRLTSVFGPGQVAWKGATGAIARFAADALAGRPIVIEGDPERTRDFVYVDDVVPAFEAIAVERRWNETITLASGAPASLRRAAELVVAAVGDAVPIETPGGTLPPGENESYVGSPADAGLPFHVRPLEEAVPLYVDWLAAIPLLKAAPEADQLARPPRRRPWRGLELGLNTPHVASEAALARAIEVARARHRGLGMAVTAEAPLAWPSGAFVRSTASTTRRAAASSAAPSSRPPSARPCSRCTSSCRRRRTSSARAARRGAVEEFLGFYAETCLDARRHAADRERAAGAADAHRRRLPVAHRRPLARSPALARARPGAALHARHLARRALPLLRGRVSDPVRARVRRGARSRPLRRGARPTRRGRARLGRARPARRGPALRRAASWISIPSSAGSASSCRTSSPRSPSRTTSRSDGHEGRLPRDRARVVRARPRRCARAVPPRARRRLRLAGACSTGAIRSPRCSSCRSGSAAGACC